MLLSGLATNALILLPNRKPKRHRRKSRLNILLSYTFNGRGRKCLSEGEGAEL